MKTITVQMDLGGRTFSLETGYLAKQAAGSVVATLGETKAFSAVCHSDPRPGLDFFPLSVDYREKLQSAGKFPGGFMKREGRPSTKEILTCRLTDRPVRPMWPEGYKDEIQVCSFVVQIDRQNDPDMASMNASFAALHIADLPFQGPMGAVRVGRFEGKLVVNPTDGERSDSDLEIIFAGTRDAITMVEGTCAEISEDDFLECIDFAHNHIRSICNLMDEFLKKTGTVKTPHVAKDVNRHPVYDQIMNSGEYDARLKKALLTTGKHARDGAVKAVRTEVMDSLISDNDAEANEKSSSIKSAWHDLESNIVRAMILDGKRVDGRGLADIRDIDIVAGWQPRLHGSAVFTRGETQALVVCTLGTLKDQQIVDGLAEEYSKKFDFQYNFPPYCVGEVKPMRGVSRREIGHGNLAERALMAALPEPMDFPYTIRLISDILESNGSSSMASVCGGTIAMMDAGVPLKQPVAGIAMGLLKDGDKVAILSDILGSEDHHGDMDFKVAGTGRGITAVQMDIKIKGVSKDIMSKALSQAKDGRLHILKCMMNTLDRPAASISEFAPRLLLMKVPVEKIGLIIGPGGKNIKRIQEETGAKVEIEDDGSVHISGLEALGAEEAQRQIQMIIAEVEIGAIYRAKVVSIKDFGCFVEVLPGQEGLVHVSELSNEFVSKVSDVVKMGDFIEVKVIARDEQDRIKLSRKAVLEQKKD